MEWLKEFIKSLPLDKISEIVAQVVAWWSEQVKDIPADELPFNVYVGGSLVAIVLWYFVARMLPRPLGGMTWIVMIAILLTPGVSLGETGDVAPACVAVVYSILMKDYPAAAQNFVPIAVVIILGFFLGFVWQLIRDTIVADRIADKDAKKNAKNPAKKEDKELLSQSDELRNRLAKRKNSTPVNSKANSKANSKSRSKTGSNAGSKTKTAEPPKAAHVKIKDN